MSPIRSRGRRRGSGTRRATRWRRRRAAHAAVPATATARAPTTGITIMRLADADIIPFAFTNLTATAKRYTKELQELRDDRAKEILAKDGAIPEGAYVPASDPREPT